MACNFRVGDRVVCVDDHHHEWRKEKFLFFFKKLRWVDNSICKGSVYTISQIFQGIDRITGESIIGVNLKEVHPMPGDSGFRASRFRPVVERKTDIEIFRAMLNPSKSEVRA